MDCRPRNRSEPRPACCGGIDRRKQQSACYNNGEKNTGDCSKKRERKDCSKSRDKGPIDFYQVITKVKSRMDQTFRGLEGGLRGVEKSMNDEVAKVLAQVMEFEEGMKPKLLGPYKKCKELENLVTPVLAKVPRKRPQTARCRSTSRPEERPERCKSSKPCTTGRYKSPETLGRERFRDLMCSPSLDRVNPWEGSEDQYSPSQIATRDGTCTSSQTESTDDDVGRTLKELQGISLSVNKSLKRINRAFSTEDENEKLRRAVERKPEVLNRVNESLSHIGAGAKLMQRLLSEGRSNRNC